MTKIIRTKGYEYTTKDGTKFTLLPVKKDEYFKGVVIANTRYGGTFMLHDTSAKKVTVQYRLDDTIYPFVGWIATNGDVFKHKNNYYMWTNSIIKTKEKIGFNFNGYTRLASHPAVYDFKRKRLIDFYSLDIKYPMTMVKIKICGEENNIDEYVKSKSVQRREAVQRGE